MHTETMFWLGVALVIIGLLMLVAEVHAPGFFIAVPGTMLLVLGIALLAIGNVDIYTALALMAIGAAISIAFTLWFYGRIGRPEPPTTTTPDKLVGTRGKVIKKVEPDSLRGKVRIGSEIWSATSKVEIPEGATIVVRGAEGVHLIVEEVK